MRHFTAILPICLLPVCLLAGCASVGEGPSASSVTAPSAFVYAPPTAERGVIASLLPAEDPAFRALMAGLETSAPDLQIALARVETARAALRAAGAAQAPNVSADARIASLRSSEAAVTNLPPGAAFDKSNSSFASTINASWDLDLFGRLRASKRAAILRLNAADADAKAVRLALVTDIARAVIDYRIAQSRLAIVEEDIASATVLVNLTNSRTRAGLSPGLDLVRAQGLEAAARSERNPADADMASALGRLVTLTAQDGVSIKALFSTPSDLNLFALPSVALPSALLRQRPDIVAAEFRLGAANAEIAASAAARFPQISINAALGLAALTLGDLFRGEALTASAGSSVSLPLLDFGRVEAQIDASQAEAKEAFGLYRRAVFASFGEAESALGALQANRERLAALEAQSLIEKDSVMLSTVRYRMGLSDSLGVIEAQRQRNRTRQLLVEARGATLRSQIQLYRSFGG